MKPTNFILVATVALLAGVPAAHADVPIAEFFSGAVVDPSGGSLFLEATGSPFGAGVAVIDGEHVVNIMCVSFFSTQPGAFGVLQRNQIRATGIDERGVTVYITAIDNGDANLGSDGYGVAYSTTANGCADPLYPAVRFGNGGFFSAVGPSPEVTASRWHPAQ